MLVCDIPSQPFSSIIKICKNGVGVKEFTSFRLHTERWTNPVVSATEPAWSGNKMGPYDLCTERRFCYACTLYKQISLHLTQRGESTDFLQLFCICIQTELVRKLFISKVSMNFHAVKWKYLVIIRRVAMFKYFMLPTVFLHTTSSKDFHTLFEFMWKNTTCMKTALT